MSEAAAALVAAFADRAASAETAERQLRARLNDEMARAALERTYAYRRARLVRTLAAHTDGDRASVVAKQRRAVTAEIGWSGETDAEKAILDRLGPVAAAVSDCACGEAAGSHDEVMRHLAAFEAWFSATHGKSFYTLFDQYVTEVPVVDF